MALDSTSTYYIPVLSALGINILSVLYGTLSFATSDRVSGKNRRVILPAHITQVLWYLCLITSRLVALALLAYLHDYYVFALVGGHWILMFFFLLIQRTTFCADIERQNDGELKFTRRLCLEIPFDLVAAAIYVFVYFNPKRGRTRYWAGIFHLLMLVENAAIGVLFFKRTEYPDIRFFPLSAMIFVIGLYFVGLSFMLCYYLFYHPKKTGNCYWVGCPRECHCCCSQNEELIIPKPYQNRNSTSVIISDPTLVSHNGFVPKNLLPVGPRSAEIENQKESIPHSQSVRLPNGHTNRSNDHVTRSRRSMTEIETRRRIDNGNTTQITQFNSRARQSQDLIVSPSLSVSPPSHTNTAQRATGSNLAYSSDNIQSYHVQSDTDVSSCMVETMDTVIDTPIPGFTPEIVDTPAHVSMQTRITSQGSVAGGGGRGLDTESQRTYTNDTGIDVDSDLQLTQGTLGGEVELELAGIEGGSDLHFQLHGKDDQFRLPVFVDIPVKHKNYRSGLEKHYFPDEKDGKESLETTHQNRDSVTPTLPTPTYSPSPPSLTPGSNQVKWGQQGKGSDEVFSPSSPQHANRDVNLGVISYGSQPSPERQRKSPRSPIGARSFQVNADEAETSSQQSSQNHSIGPRAGTPRSPKGARHLLIQQPVPTTTTPDSKVANIQHHRQAPPPPIPPKALKEDGTSDELTRGLTSLVAPIPKQVGRAYSSSPNPVSRHLAVLQDTHATTSVRGYSRAKTFDATRLSNKRPRGVSYYRQVGAVGNNQDSSHTELQQRPKSDGWRADDRFNVHAIQQRNLNVSHHQFPLNSHRSSSPERTSTGGLPYNSSEDQLRRNLAQQNQTAYLSNPNSAFKKVSNSPSRNHAYHTGNMASRGSLLSDSYPMPHVSARESVHSLSSSYPKAPQGAPPRMSRVPPTKRLASSSHFPSHDDSINKLLMELDPSKYSQNNNMGNMSIDGPRDGSFTASRMNRGRGYTILHTPKSSAHESVV